LRRMLHLAPLFLVEFAGIRDLRAGEATHIRKVLIVVQDDATVTTHPEYVPPEEDEAVRLATLLVREIPNLGIEGVPTTRVDGICARTAVCDEIHVYRRFTHPNYRLHIQLHNRSGRVTGIGPRTEFPCRVGAPNHWSVCRGVVVTRMKGLVEQGGS
jgi:hypothetical protein